MRTLVDSSVWIDHLRNGNDGLRRLLVEDGVLMHPFIVGELACGGLSPRAAVLGDLTELPHAIQAGNDEVMTLIEERKLWGRGIGFVDAHLVAAALLSGCRLWTLDRALRAVAASLEITQ